jgi:hypothetical protein
MRSTQLQHSRQLNAGSLLARAQKRFLCGGKGCGTPAMTFRHIIRRRFSTISIPKKGKERQFDNRSFEIENHWLCCTHLRVKDSN